MWRIFALILVVFLLVSCSNNSPSGPGERGTFDLTIRNLTNEPNVFFLIRNYYFSETGRWYWEDTSYVEFSFEPIETESTWFYSYGVVVDVYEDTIINTIDCDSILWDIGKGISVYYEE